MAIPKAVAVFPVGHYGGSFPLDTVTPLRCHEVRRGQDVLELTEEQYTVWSAAHGWPDAASRRPWTAQRVVEAASGRGVADPGRVLAQLLAEGLLAQVAPGHVAERDFARGHRLLPLMLGLGNSPVEPGLYTIGLFGRPVVRVTRPIFALWEWAHLDANLWEACQTFAHLERVSGGTDPETTDPMFVLHDLLGTLHLLLAANAACVDVASGS